MDRCSTTGTRYRVPILLANVINRYWCVNHDDMRVMMIVSELNRYRKIYLL